MEYGDGKMTMHRADSVTVPADGEVALKSGGTHLMLMKLRRELQAGDDVTLVLRFADGTVKRVVAPVRKGGYATR
jgi:copper(I)-binding protein